MNSKTIHQLEKLVHKLLFTTLAIYVCYKFLPFLGLYVGMITSFFTLAYYTFKTLSISSPFIAKGKKLSKRIGLKRLLVVETNLIPNHHQKVYELHHMSNGYFKGFFQMTRKYQDIMSDFETELLDDFLKLISWMEKEDAYIVTTTHLGMKTVWQRNSSNLLFKRSEELLDPYVKMPLFQWALESFALTGRLKLKRFPRDWNTYFLTIGSKEE